MKYILMMNATKAEFAEYATWLKKDLQANVALMRAFSKELRDSGVFVATGLWTWKARSRLTKLLHALRRHRGPTGRWGIWPSRSAKSSAALLT